MKIITQEFISLPMSVKQDMLTQFNVTMNTVLNALTYRTRGGAAAQIREYAINHGGIYNKVKIYEDSRIPM